jgi:hypothetical protein
MKPHLNSEEISGWIAGERKPDWRNHLATCALCRSDVDQIEYAFWQFRDSGRRWSAHWYTAREVRPPRAFWRWRWLTATGALVSTAVVVLMLARPTAIRKPEEEPFLPIPYVASLGPYEQTTVVRMDVAMTALKASGFEIHAPELSGALTVDVLVGQDGRAHAIRPIYRR